MRIKIRDIEEADALPFDDIDIGEIDTTISTMGVEHVSFGEDPLPYHSCQFARDKHGIYFELIFGEEE